MKIFIEEYSLRLQSHDQEERACFMQKCNKLGITVKKNKIGHLDAFGSSEQLYALIFILTLEWNLTIH